MDSEIMLSKQLDQVNEAQSARRHLFSRVTMASRAGDTATFKRIVRSAEGADRYGVSVGSPIPGPGEGASEPDPKADTFMVGKPEGVLEGGNLDLHNRPRVENEDGSISTVRSITVTDDNGVAFLLPTVSKEGKIMSDKDAVAHFQKTKEHLGIFKDEKSADKYAEKLHLSQEKEYEGKPPTHPFKKPEAPARPVDKKNKASVLRAQKLLIKKGAKIKADGIWGPKTQDAADKDAKDSRTRSGPNKRSLA